MAKKHIVKAKVKELGRPSKFTQELADKICDKVATSSSGLRKICEENEIDYSTVKRWLIDNTDFCAQYARAKEEQAEHLADEIIAIADDGSNDTKIIKDKQGNDIEVEDTEWTSRSKLKVEARKWIASKLKPKKYGDKVQTELSGEVGIKQITGMKVE
jgi:hypothetical protein